MMESIEKLRDESYIPGYRGEKTLGMLADEIEAEIAERYMLLPVDADGVPIRVGDVMCSVGIREKGHKVIVSAIFEDGFVEYGNDNGLIGPLFQEDWVHIKPRTLEDVLADFASKQHGITKEENDALIAECAEEIRELMEVDR